MDNNEDGDDDQPMAPPKPLLKFDDTSSLLDLQAEYLKRKKAVSSSFTSCPEKYVNKPKNNILALTKEEKRAKQEISEKRFQRIKQNEDILRKEEFDRGRQRKILEHKEKIYNRMSNGESLTFDDGKSADFLVDFTMKKKEMEKNDLVAQKESNDSEVVEDMNPLVVHYDPTEERGRVFGPSHVPLPIFNEDARQKKIAELKEMTVQTRIERSKHRKVQNEKKAEERRRLNRIRTENGLPPMESSSESEDDTQEEVPNSSTLKTPIDVPTLAPQPPKKPKVREWDRGKIGHMKWINSQRDEREDEFKPPDFYYK